MRKYRIGWAGTLVLALACGMLASCADSGGTGGGAATDDAAERLARFIAEADREDLDRDPTLRTYKSKSVSESSWTRENDEFAAESARLLEQRIRQLQQEFDREQLPAGAQRQYDIYLDELRTAQMAQRILRNSVTLHLNVFDPSWRLPEALRDLHRVEQRVDADNYVSRLRALPQILDDVIETGRERKSRGVVLLASNYQELADQARALSHGAPCPAAPDAAGAADEHVLFADFQRKLDGLELPAEERRDLLDAASGALVDALCPAYAAFADTLEDEFVPHGRTDGVWALPNGPEAYRELVHFNLGTRMDPDEVHRIGREEVARLQAEIDERLEALGAESVAEVEARLLQDPERSVPVDADGYEALRTYSQEHIDFVMARLDEQFLRLPRTPMEIRATTVGPTGVPGTHATYYTPAPRDGTAPAYFNLGFPTPGPGAPERISLLGAATTAFHEAVPGHHLQQAMAQELNPRVPLTRYHGYMSFIEGWGLYGEQVAHEMGGFQGDPYAELGWKVAQLERAVRLVLDTGLNYKGWSEADGQAYHREVMGRDGRMYRYLMWPGQALGYHLGYLEILKERERAREALGEAFDIRVFHDAVLRDGTVSLDLVRAAVDDMIAAGGTAGAQAD